MMKVEVLVNPNEDVSNKTTLFQDLIVNRHIFKSPMSVDGDFDDLNSEDDDVENVKNYEEKKNICEVLTDDSMLLVFVEHKENFEDDEDNKEENTVFVMKNDVFKLLMLEAE